MELKIIEKKDKEIRLEIDDQTMCEALRKELWEDKSVLQASYFREHPTKNPVLHVQTEGKSAKKALQDAIDRLEVKNQEFVKTFKAAVK